MFNAICSWKILPVHPSAGRCVSHVLRVSRKRSCSHAKSKSFVMAIGILSCCERTGIYYVRITPSKNRPRRAWHVEGHRAASAKRPRSWRVRANGFAVLLLPLLLRGNRYCHNCIDLNQLWQYCIGFLNRGSQVQILAGALGILLGFWCNLFTNHPCVTSFENPWQTLSRSALRRWQTLSVPSSPGSGPARRPSFS